MRAPRCLLTGLLALLLLAGGTGQAFLFYGAARAEGEPYVESTIPDYDESLVPVDTIIEVTFSESMNLTATEAAFSILPSVGGSFDWTTDNITMIFTPTANLSYGTQYTVKITEDAKSLADLQMENDYEWSFTTIDTISVTVYADPMDFGNPSAGTEGQAATVSPSITIVNNGTSIVEVYLKATVFIGDAGTIPVDHIFCNDDDDFGYADNLSTEYGTSAWREIDPGHSLDIYYWVSIPGGTPPGDYSANFTYLTDEAP
jgi:hypothetical protein